MTKIKFSPGCMQEISQAEIEWIRILKEKTGALAVFPDSIEHPPLDDKVCREYDADFVSFLRTKNIPFEII